MAEFLLLISLHFWYTDCRGNEITVIQKTENQAEEERKMKPARQLTSAQRKRKALDETAGRLTDIIMGHLAALPKAERKLRIAKADKRIQAALKRGGSAGIQATPSRRDETSQIRLAARSRP